MDSLTLQETARGGSAGTRNGTQQFNFELVITRQTVGETAERFWDCEA